MPPSAYNHNFRRYSLSIVYVLLLLLLLLLLFLSSNERVSASQPASQHENSHEEEKESVRCACWLVSRFVSVPVFWIFWITLPCLFYASSKLWSVVEDYGGIADIRENCVARGILFEERITASGGSVYEFFGWHEEGAPRACGCGTFCSFLGYCQQHRHQHQHQHQQ